MGERWSCPGRLCGTYQGYQRGCSDPLCTATVADYTARRRAGSPATSRSRPIDTAAKTTVLQVLRERGTIAAAAAAIGVTEYRLAGARRRDLGFGEQVQRLARRRLGSGRPTQDDLERYLAQLRAGRTVEDAATQVGWEYSAIYYRRLTDRAFDLEVVAAAADGAPEGRPGPAVRAVHRLNYVEQR